MNVSNVGGAFHFKFQWHSPSRPFATRSDSLLLLYTFGLVPLSRYLQSLQFIMVRHKKDGASKAKKFSTKPRHTPRPPREGDEDGGAPVRPPFKAACWDFGHCDAKRCSGKRLMHFGMMRELPIGQKWPGVVIS